MPRPTYGERSASRRVVVPILPPFAPRPLLSPPAQAAAMRCAKSSWSTDVKLLCSKLYSLSKLPSTAMGRSSERWVQRSNLSDDPVASRMLAIKRTESCHFLKDHRSPRLLLPPLAREFLVTDLALDQAPQCRFEPGELCCPRQRVYARQARTFQRRILLGVVTSVSQRCE